MPPPPSHTHTRLSHLTDPPAHKSRAGDKRLNQNAAAMAASCGILVDGVKLHAFMTEVSKIMEEAIAVDDPKASARDPAFAPNGAKHTPFPKACDTVRDTRWNRVVHFFGRINRAVGKTDASTIMGEGIANSIAGKGHGADRRRRLVEPGAFLDALLARPEVRERLKKKIAERERPADHVQDMILRKRKTCSTYDMIDGYRDLFLVKHPGRGTMNSHTKKLIAYLYANVMSCGKTWAMEEELEELRLHAARGAAEEVREIEERERADDTYRAWCQKHSTEFASIARARRMGGSKWMKIAKEQWPTAAENPKNINAGDSAGDSAGGGAMDTSDREGGEDSDDAMETERNLAANFAEYDEHEEFMFAAYDEHDEFMMDADEAGGVGEGDGEGDGAGDGASDGAGGGDTPPDCAPDAEGAANYWTLAGLMFAEIKWLKSRAGAATAREPIAFVTELLKTKAGQGIGRFGLAAFTELLAHCRTHGVTQVMGRGGAGRGGEGSTCAAASIMLKR